ncbi:hypothetical protein OBBRIDRAFT_250127 [Obba rivulosa]|uniref:Uncharacterized protein n=1 Tax=Obba rivulosa TaxID=1052685 RepID=A0A8E2DKX7_9APHY|nr:hypothetical protein OBBRIDRAFT_250127 [Obba rivulosa]
MISTCRRMLHSNPESAPQPASTVSQRHPKLSLAVAATLPGIHTLHVALSPWELMGKNGAQCPGGPRHARACPQLEDLGLDIFTPFSRTLPPSSDCTVFLPVLRWLRMSAGADRPSAILGHLDLLHVHGMWIRVGYDTPRRPPASARTGLSRVIQLCTASASQLSDLRCAEIANDGGWARQAGHV